MVKVRNSRKYGFKKDISITNLGARKKYKLLIMQKKRIICRIDEEEFQSFVGENLEMVDSGEAPRMDCIHYAEQFPKCPGDLHLAPKLERRRGFDLKESFNN